MNSIALGTWAFASQIYGDVPAQDAHDTVRYALDHGVTTFDTAPLYGSKTEDGISERILADALGDALDRVTISTKFGRYMTDGAMPKFDAERARDSVEGSLRRLRRDRIDVLFFHSPFGPHDINDDVWAELDKLKQEGKVGQIGHSISKFEDTEAMAREWAAERKIEAVQVVYSLMNREAASLITDLGEAGIEIYAREVMANGFLSGRITPETTFEAGHLNARYSREEIEARAAYADDLSFLIRGDITTLPQAAYRWVLDQPGVTLALSGARTPAELADAVRAAEAASYTADELTRADTVHTRDFEAA